MLRYVAHMHIISIHTSSITYHLRRSNYVPYSWRDPIFRGFKVVLLNLKNIILKLSTDIASIVCFHNSATNISMHICTIISVECLYTVQSIYVVNKCPVVTRCDHARLAADHQQLLLVIAHRYYMREKQAQIHPKS